MRSRSVRPSRRSSSSSTPGGARPEAQLDVLPLECVDEIGEHVERADVDLVVAREVEHERCRRRLGGLEQLD
jgi:hypothetical protein